MKTPHVAITCSMHPPGDVRIFSRWVKSFANAGWRVTLIAPLRGDLPKFPENVTYHEVEFLTSYKNRLSKANRVLPHLEEANPDLVLFPDPELMPVMLAYKRKSGSVVVFDRHENYTRPGVFFQYGLVSSALAYGYGMYERYAAPRLDGVIVVLEEMAKSMHPKTNCITARNFPTMEVLDSLKASDQPNAKSYICINIGGLGASRGLYEMLEVARILVFDRKRSEFTLCLGGVFEPGSLDKCEAFVEEHNLSDNVTLMSGRMPHEQVLSLFRAAKIGLSPYHNDQKAEITLQNKILEFMGAGIPIITGPTSGNAEVIKQSGAGKLFWADQVDEICNVIEHWMDNPDEADAIGQQGLEYVTKHLVWESEFKKAINWIDGLMTDK